MNDTPTGASTALDDLERDVVRALRAKADQLLVDDRPFRADATPVEPTRLGSPGPRRRVLALAAAVAVLAGGVAAVQRLSSADDREARPGTLAAGPRYTMRDDGMAGFLPATLPDGWTLQDLDAGNTLVARSELTWQLFGDDGPSPLSPGVLVGSTANEEGRVIEDATRTIHGRPASVGPSPEPQAPDGALRASWIAGDVVHDAIAVGTTEAELVAFLESLTPHDDPTTGFVAPADADLREIETATVGDQYTARATYAGPAGGNDTVMVTTESPDRYGGLLHRLAGEPGIDGFVLHGTSGGDRDHPFASLARRDGWTLEVMSEASPSVAEDPALLDELLDGLEPVTTQQLVDIGLAEPVTATATVGGWTVDVHGTDAAALAMCLTPDAGRTACTTAEDWHVPDVTTGSAVVDGRWTVTVVADRTTSPTVQPAPNGYAEWPEGAPRDALHGEQERTGDQVVEVFTIPADVDAVGVTVPTGDGQATGITYDRPGS